MENNPEQLRQLTLEQIRALASGERVYARLVVENASKIAIHVRGYDTLFIEKQERKRKGPLITSIRPSSFPINIDLAEKGRTGGRTERGSTQEGTFFLDCGAYWVLQVFSETGEGKTLAEVESEHEQEAQRRRKEREEEDAELLGYDNDEEMEE